MKKKIVIIVLIIMILSLVGCKKDTLIGVWYDESSGQILTFTDDTCEFSNVKVDYKTEEDKLIFISDEGEDIMIYKLEGDSLTFMFDDDPEGEFSLYFIRR